MDLAVGERVLAPWVPGKDDPQCPELENIFDSPWIRNWDQFETNQKLFGIKSTFNEELYTTKLERGPHMREFEREAMRIAIEIEGEETEDLHLAEDNIPPFLATINLNRSDFNDQARRLASELPSKSFPISDSESRIQDDLLGEHRGSSDAKEFAEKQSPSEDLQLSNSVDSHSLLDDKIDASDKAGPCEKRSSSFEPSEGPASSKVIGETHSANSHGQPGSCASSNSDCVAAVSASSGPGLSPSSSMGSLSSKKSTLNPHAKEFKLNPNAKSFIPSQTTGRPPTPVSDGSFYYQPQMSPVPHMHMPVSFGIGPSFPGHQPVILSQQVAPTQSS
ncbi:hypothetical protein ES288_D10G059600v1 [Gossypium darwinii]|uniref:LsmAD domain-containing protein n=1 Tax=Gossypium darwinii TaxID=34276 RepID=A0A5D2AWV0_GOSDA|nr:hypothetical protein ES288_D10G059600v1 [Gossypium darwinii]TYG49000.1 hypothetical protein ES288_D10G059600v1 [Gossypium darwinii]